MHDDQLTTTECRKYAKRGCADCGGTGTYELAVGTPTMKPGRYACHCAWRNKTHAKPRAEGPRKPWAEVKAEKRAKRLQKGGAQ